MYKYGHVWAQRGWYAWCLFVLWSAHPWPPGTLAASPSAGCGECVLSDLLFTKEAAREARWSHLHPSRLSNLLELTNSSVRKQHKPVHDPDLALPVCWCNFLLGRRAIDPRFLKIYPYHVEKFKTTVTSLIMHALHNQHVSLKSWFLKLGTVAQWLTFILFCPFGAKFLRSLVMFVAAIKWLSFYFLVTPHGYSARVRGTVSRRQLYKWHT